MNLYLKAVGVIFACLMISCAPGITQSVQNVKCNRVDVVVSLAAEETGSLPDYPIEYSYANRSYIATGKLSEDKRSAIYTLNVNLLLSEAEQSVIEYKIGNRKEVYQATTKPLFEPKATFPNDIKESFLSPEEYISTVVDGIAYVYQCVPDGIDYPRQDRLWRYDPSTDNWDSIPLFPGCSRHSAIMFSHGDKIYLGLGFYAWPYSNKENLWSNTRDYNDIWELDTKTLKWRKAANFPGGKRYSAAAFAADGAAYIIGGYQHYTGMVLYQKRMLSDIWKWDLATGEFSEIGELPSEAFSEDFAPTLAPSGVVVGNHAYIGATGKDEAAGLWSYNLNTGKWVHHHNHHIDRLYGNENMLYGAGIECLTSTDVKMMEDGYFSETRLKGPCFVIGDQLYGFCWGEIIPLIHNKPTKSSSQYIVGGRRSEFFDGAFGLVHL
ncbi:MAG: kelch repeat-containing protein [Alistipes sp.]